MYLYPIWCGFDNFSMTIFDFPQLKTANIATVRKQSERSTKPLKAIVAYELLDPILFSRLCQYCNKSHSIKPNSG